MNDVAVTWTVALTWLGASLAFSALLGLSILAAELLVASFGRPRRGLWAVALAMTVIWPLAGWFMVPRVAPEWVVRPYEPVAASVSAELPPAAASVVGGEWSMPSLPPVVTVGVVWGVLSLVMAGVVLRGVLLLRRTRRAARQDVLLGETVLRTRDVGPAVVGVGRASLLMPEWLWELDEKLQRLVLHHELEHQRAGDPWLVWGGVLATVLTPWNPVVWWMTYRLRLAMEIDCDARTMRAHPDAASQYPRLLLLIAHMRQRPQYTPQLAPLLIPSASQLSRRMRAMKNPMPLRSPLAKLAVAAIAFGLWSAACSRQIAGNLAGPAVPVVLESVPGEGVSVAPSDSVTSAAAKDSVYFDFQVERPAEALPPGFGPRFHEALGTLKVDGDVLMQFVVDPNGRVREESIKVLQSPHPDLAKAVVVGLSELRFQPALRGNQPVAQLVQQRSSFLLGKQVIAARAANQRDPLTKARIDSVLALRKAKQAELAQSGGSPRTDSVPSKSATDRVLFDFEVETPATFVPGSRGPAYPADARSRGLSGTVLAQFVVDVDGTVVPGSIRIVRSTDSLFSAAVEQFLPQARFRPAQNGGQPVKQLLQQPFEFEQRKD